MDDVSSVTVKVDRWKLAMQEVLAALPDDVVLGRNRVGNLSVYNAATLEQIGHIDVLNPELALYADESEE